MRTRVAVPSLPRRWSAVPVGLAVFTAALTIAILRITTLSELFGVRLRMPWTMNDFKTAIYCPAAIFLQGGNPYDRAQFLHFCPVQDVFPLYFPSTLVLHAPFGVLPILPATLLYFGISVALSVLVVHLGFRLAGTRPGLGNVLLGTGVLLFTRPGQWNLLLGQPALELTVATYLALSLARRAPLLSGMALAVSMYKPTFGIPLAVLMLVRGDQRALLVGILSAAVLNGVPLAVLALRSGGPEVFVQDLLRSQKAWEAVVDPSKQVYGVDAPGLLSRLLGRRLHLGEYLTITGLVLGIAAAALRSLSRMDDERSAQPSMGVVCLGILLSVHHHAYDLVLLVAPVIAVVVGALPAELLGARRVALLGLFGLLGVNYVTTLSVLHRFTNQAPIWVMLASLNGAALLIAFLVYVAPLTGWSSTSPAPSRGQRRGGAQRSG